MSKVTVIVIQYKTYIVHLFKDIVIIRCNLLLQIYSELSLNGHLALSLSQTPL